MKHFSCLLEQVSLTTQRMSLKSQCPPRTRLSMHYCFSKSTMKLWNIFPERLPITYRLERNLKLSETSLPESPFIYLWKIFRDDRCHQFLTTDFTDFHGFFFITCQTRTNIAVINFLSDDEVGVLKQVHMPVGVSNGMIGACRRRHRGPGIYQFPEEEQDVSFQGCERGVCVCE